MRDDERWNMRRRIFHQSTFEICRIVFPLAIASSDSIRSCGFVLQHAKIMIAAHDSPLAALMFNHAGTRIATASEKGTVIRVFNVADGMKLYEFRRGVKRCVTISCLAFSQDGSLLCCSSNTETVHIFKLEEPKEMYVLGWVPLVRVRPECPPTWKRPGISCNLGLP